MKNEQFIKSISIISGIISLGTAIVFLLLILNWFFKITPFQKFQGLPLLIAPFPGVVGFVLGIISFEKEPNNFSKWGIVSNGILFVLPFLYMILGTLVFGP